MIDYRWRVTFQTLLKSGSGGLQDFGGQMTQKLRSSGATHRLQPFQPSSELVAKVDQLNQPKTFRLHLVALFLCGLHEVYCHTKER